MAKQKIAHENNVFTTLNNYGYDDNSIEEVKTYLLKYELPKRLNTVAKRERFRTKWRDYKTVSGYLIYKPLNLKVIPDSEREGVLKEMYSDISVGVGAGVTQFYHHVQQKYLNIFRRQCEVFLKQQKVFQMTRPLNHKINKPVLATYPNERWCIDLIDMNKYLGANNRNRYILTCIDYFSRFAWATPLKLKESGDVVEGLDRIVAKAGGIYPKILMKDNGGEFQGETNDWMKAHNIDWINTLSYSPQSNGLIENFNGQLRKMLREVMIRTNSQNWVNNLQVCCDNKNSQRNSTIKARPLDVWKPNYNIAPVNVTARRIRANAKRQVDKNKTKELQVGQIVRVKMNALFSSVRKMIKDNVKKYIVVKYSPTVYRIAKILEPDHAGYEKFRYTLETIDGQVVQTQLKNNNPNAVRRAKRFFASDFLPVDEDTEDQVAHDFKMEDAHKLNETQTEEPVVAVTTGLTRREQSAAKRAVASNENWQREERRNVRRAGSGIVVGGKLCYYCEALE